MDILLARDAQAKLALIVAQCLSIHLSICVSVRDSLSHAYVYVRSIARREPRRLPACICTCLNQLLSSLRVRGQLLHKLQRTATKRFMVLLGFCS